MATARDIIEASLRKIHVVGRGQSLPSDEANDALDTLNAMLDSWSVEGGLVYAETQETFSLTGAQSYTIGDGGDFDTVLPVDIVAAFISIAGTDYPLELIDREQYAEITDKSLGSFVADVLYYDNNYPLATIRMHPVPASGTLTLYSNKPLTRFSSLDTVYSMPVGYERALVYNLAVDIAPEYEKEAGMSVMRIANESKSNVLSANTRNDNNQSNIDSALLGNNTFNIYKGY